MLARVRRWGVYPTDSLSTRTVALGSGAPSGVRAVTAASTALGGQFAGSFRSKSITTCSMEGDTAGAPFARRSARPSPLRGS